MSNCSRSGSTAQLARAWRVQVGEPYLDGTNVMVASVTTSPTFAVLSRTALFEDRFDNAGTQDWHVFPDGNHFAMVRPVQNESELAVALNALAELRRAAKK